MLNRSIPPNIKDPISFHFHLPPCEQKLLDNGIPFYWFNAGTQDVIQIEWVFKAGLWEEKQTGIAQSTSALLKNGTSTKNAFQINEALEQYGAYLNTSSNNDFNTITLHALTKRLPVLLPMIQELILDAIYPEEELAIYQNNALQRLNINLEKTEFVANRNIDSFVFGASHPYGKFTQREDILALNSMDLRQFHRQYFSTSNCRIFMAGRFNDADVALIGKYFGKDNWGGNEKTTGKKHETMPVNEKKHRLQLSEEPNIQGSIRLSSSFLKRDHPDFIPMILVNTIFGGYFGSRLMNNIREEKGYTYGIDSHIFSYKEESALMISSEVGTKVCEPTIHEVYKEMARIRTELISDEELLLVKNYLLGNILGDLDGPFSIMQKWKSIVLFDLPWDSFEKNITCFKTLSASEIQELANKYLQQDQFYELIVV